MKTKKFLMLLAAVLLSCASAMAQNSPLKGDVNGDGKVDVGDIVAILEIMKNGGKELQSIKWASTTAVNGTTGTTPSLGDITLTFNDGTTGTVAYNASGVTLYSDAAGNTPFSNANPGTFSVWAKFCGMTTTNSKQVTLSAPVVVGTYYWYVGQTDPSTMTEISPIVDDLTSPGWRLIGTSLPNYNSSNKLFEYVEGGEIITGSSLAKQYIAIPANSSACPRDGLGNDASTVDMYTKLSNVTISGVTYKVYETVGKSKKLAIDIY